MGVATLALVLHTLAVVAVWMGWGRGLRGGALVWIDLPVSLAYLHRGGRRLLVWSLLAGGAWWALVGALAAWVVGLLARRRPRPS
jgi:hypothetical protein